MFVRKKRAPARKAKAGKKRAKAAKPKGGLHLPAGLEQRHLDLIGLFLVAFGVYLVFVLFFGWEGGKVGYGVETGLTYLFGTVGARIFTVLMLLVGGMLLTGTSVSALVRGIGRGLRAIFRAVFHGGDAAAKTVARTHADWREQRETRCRGRDRGRRDRRDELLSRTPTSSSRPCSWPRSPRTSPTWRSPPTTSIANSRTSRPARRTRSTRSSTRTVAEAEPRCAPDPDGREARRHDLGRDRLPAAAREGAGTGQRRQGARPARPGSHRPQAGRDPGPLRGRGEDRRRRQRPARLPLRTAPGAGDQGEESHRAGQRPRLRAGLDRHPHPRPDSRQAGGRGRGPERAPPHRPPRRHLRRPPGEDLAAGRLARQGDRRQPGLDRPGEDAARARRRHHRLGQERLRQRRSSPRS